jgi:hypothetical protein
MATVPQLGYIGEKLNLLVRQGATLGPHSVTVRNPDLTPVNLTGSTVRGQIRRKALDVAIIETLNVVVTDAVNGVFEFGLTATETAALVAGEGIGDANSKYVWDMEWEDSTGRILPLFYGDCTVFREVTR